jgi:hypothetical protein
MRLRHALTAAILSVRWIFDGIFQERVKRLINVRRVGSPRTNEPG